MTDLSTPETPEPAAPAPGTPPAALVAFMAERWAAREAPDAEPVAAAPYAARRRALLSARFPGEWLVVPTGTAPTRANDTDYRFRPGSDFAWLVGHPEPDGVLVMAPTPDGHRSTLFVEPRADRSTPAFFTDRRNGELWVGPRRGLAESASAYAIDTAPLDALEAALAEVGDDPCRVLRGLDARVDALAPAAEAPGDDEEPSADAELATACSELRLVKDAHEVAMLEAAVASTVRGFTDVVRSLGDAVATSERWIEGTFYRRARVEGNDVGYGTIAACGVHATTLHWERNDGPVRPGDLLLLDAGVESHDLYTADVTRTLPVSGRFSAEQREVYELVLAAQRAGLAAVRPGAEFLDPHRAAMRVIAEGLHAMGILTVDVEQALDPEQLLYRRYTLHGTSHMLGLDVHDCASAREEVYRGGPLLAGYVLTVEPGCYFQPDDLTVPERYRGIGVRIEDDVLVTDDEPGHVVLSAALPTDPDEIEAWMASLAP